MGQGLEKKVLDDVLGFYSAMDNIVKSSPDLMEMVRRLSDGSQNKAWIPIDLIKYSRDGDTLYLGVNGGDVLQLQGDHTRVHSDATFHSEGNQYRNLTADKLYDRMTNGQESFWKAVYPLYFDRSVPRPVVESLIKELVKRGLRETNGRYKLVVRLYNAQGNNGYKRFLNFLRKHDLQLPYRQFRNKF